MNEHLREHGRATLDLIDVELGTQTHLQQHLVERPEDRATHDAVSYTHLTLPTIYAV